MKITVLGANGRTGYELVMQALAAGYSVNALVHHMGRFVSQPKLKIMVGDATKVDDVVRASRGSDVVISTLGSASMRSTLISEAVRAVIAASQVSGVKRFILMSNFVVGDNKFGGIMWLGGGIAKRVFKDKAQSEAILKQSDLEWTIVHAATLDDSPLGSGIRVVSKSERMTLKHKVARADVAAWMLNEALRNSHAKASVTLSR